MKKYEVLDKAIMNKIGGHPQKLGAIFVCDVADECRFLADTENAENSRRAVEPFRIAARRLQALRRAGAITFTSKGWIRVKEQS